MGLFKNSDATCPVEGDNATGELITKRLTFQHILLIAGGVCTLITLCCSISLILKHLRQYVKPLEQRQIVRIIYTPIIFAVHGLLSIAFYGAAIYLEPIALLYEAFALASLFLLFIQYIAPGGHHTKQSFYGIRFALEHVTPGRSFGWFIKTWIFIFFFCFATTILMVAREASQTTGKYCATSNSAHFGHIWIEILSAIFVVMAVSALLRFYRRTNSAMATHRPGAKILTFKLIVFLNFIQGLAFNFLNSGGHLKGNEKITHLDLFIGVPALLVCLEQAIFSIIFLKSYSCAEYCSGPGGYVPNNNNNERRFTVFSAAAHAFNPADLLLGIWRAFGLLPSFFGGASQRSIGGHGDDIESTSTTDEDNHRAAKLVLTSTNERL